MNWLYFLLGIGFLKSWQVCARGMDENEENDSRDESWQSVIELERRVN